MRPILGVALGLVIAVPAPSAAHRLDEYLQATRLGVASDRVLIEVDLTPGASVASRVIAMLDRDSNGEISPIEAQSYGQTVLTAVVFEVDGLPVPLALTRVDVPSAGDMREGVGTIRLEASAETAATAPGRHELLYRNNHQSEIGVYLVNTLVPQSREIAITAQHRDAAQHQVRVDYDVLPVGTPIVAWLLVATLSLGLLTVLRATENRTCESRDLSIS